MAQSARHELIRRCLPMLACPLCQGPFALTAGSLKCSAGHTYDIAARGYVHLAPDKPQPLGYDRDSFRLRGAFLNAGYYDHILEAVLQALPQGPLVDAGCGQGWFAQRAAAHVPGPVVALDLSREGVRLGAGSSRGVCWLVADLAGMPLKSGAMAAVVNLFSPANYGEFRRVLRPEGLVIKAAPGPLHLKELRQLAQGLLPPDGPNTGQVEALFRQQLDVMNIQSLTRTLPLPAEHRAWLAGMTPMLFGKDIATLPLERLQHITIDARLLIGRQKQGLDPRNGKEQP